MSYKQELSEHFPPKVVEIFASLETRVLGMENKPAPAAQPQPNLSAVLTRLSAIEMRLSKLESAKPAPTTGHSA